MRAPYSLFIISFFSLFSSISAIASTTSTSYEKFQQYALDARKVTEREGLAYIIGGSVGMASSTTLNITTTEVIPKVGYSLIQTLSAASIVHGALLYYDGDDLWKESRSLLDFQKALSIANLSAEQKRLTLDTAVKNRIERIKHSKIRTRKVRGWLELLTAASAGATLGFSKVSSTASNLTLGFIILISTAGGLGDLLASEQGLDSNLNSLINQAMSDGPATLTVGHASHEGLIQDRKPYPLTAHFDPVLAAEDGRANYGLALHLDYRF